MSAIGVNPETKKPINLDVKKVLESRMLITANSGGGKSHCIRRTLEVTHGQVQHIVIDVEDEFLTLREKFDYVLAGSKGSDCPAHPGCAAMLARRLLELRVSAIVGLYELQHYERIRFVRLFIDSLINAPKELWHPVLVVVDEAHIFAPENGRAESSTAVIDLMTRGRKRGFCGILATQRISKLSKDAVAECNNKLIGRCSLDIDIKRASDELGLTAKLDQQQLRRLPPGDFFCFGPALSDAVSKVHIDATETTHPKSGQYSGKEIPPRETVKKMLSQLADLPAEAEQEARTVSELQKQVRDLQRQVAAKPLPPKPAIAVAPKPVEVFVEAAITRDHPSVIRAFNEGFQHATSAIQHTLNTMKRSLRAEIPVEVIIPETKPSPRIAQKISVPAKVVWASIPPRNSEVIVQPNREIVLPCKAFDGTLKKNERAILIALAQYPEGRSRDQIAVLSGYSNTSGGFGSGLADLRAYGFISGSGMIAITQSGLDTLGHFDRLPTGGDLLAYWLKKLDKCESKIIEFLSLNPGVSRQQLAEGTGYSGTSGGFGAALAKLHKLELIEGRGDSLKVHDLLTA